MTIKCQKVPNFASVSRGGSVHRNNSATKNMRQLRSTTAAKCKTNLTMTGSGNGGAKSEMSSQRGSPAKQARNSNSSFEQHSVFNTQSFRHDHFLSTLYRQLEVKEELLQRSRGG